MSNRASVKSSVSLVPGRWSLPLLAQFFLISPFQFLLMAAMDVFQQFITMASFLIPIKLLFLASRGDSDLRIPYFDVTVPTGQMEVTLMIVPLAMLPLAGSFLKKYGVKKKEVLTGKVGELQLEQEFSSKQLKIFQSLVNSFSRSFSSFCLASACFLAMLLILPEVAAILGACVFMAILVARYRVTTLQKKRELEPEDEGNDDMGDPVIVARRINDTTHASFHIILLPLFVYLMAGALLDGVVDPIFALAFLLLFRLFVSSSEVSSAMGSQFLHVLIKQRDILRLLNTGKIRL